MEVTPSNFEGNTGIFTALNTYNVPWQDEGIADNLNTMYYRNHSGKKLISPIVESMLDDTTPSETQLSEYDVSSLAAVIYTMYRDRWARLWTALTMEYNPLSNYDMVEESEDTSTDEYGMTVERTDNLSHKRTGTETESPNVTEQTTPNLTNKIERNVYGYDGGLAPSESSTEENTGNSTIKRTGENTTEYNTTDADTGTQSTAHGGQDVNTSKHRLTRSGNIGVTTSQQMLESELEIRKWNYFNDIVFVDIDRVLTLAIY